MLLSTFVQYLAHSARRSSWTLSLPELATDTQPRTRSFRAALNAVSLAYFAHSTTDKSFKGHATSEYGRALSFHRHDLMRLSPTAHAHIEANAEAQSVLKQTLLTCTILSYYELIAAMDPSAWAIHTEACERLVYLLGPDLISKDVLVRQLAVSVRSHAILRAAIYGHRSIFSYQLWIGAARDWTKAQLQNIARDAYDWVVEFVLRVSLHPLSNQITDDARSLQAYSDLLLELESNYADFLLSLTPPIFPSNLPLLQDSTVGIPGAATSLTLPDLPLALRPQFASMAFAYFHAAALLFQSRFPWSEAALSRNVEWIISVGQYLEQDSRTNATGILRMGFPFAIAWRCQGVDAHLRQYAHTVFERWCRREGMTGLSVIAFS